jgi:putative oxidoreductase
MFAKLETIIVQRASVLLVPARLLLSFIFLHEAIVLLFGFSAASEVMSKQGVPPVILAATIALQLLSGLMIVLGWHGRLGALALGLFCVMTAFLFHSNFQNHDELLHFEKDLAIAGGMFAITILGTGRLSLDQYI